MTRLMLYTFHGPNRTGAEAAAQLHEAPWVMTGPLVVRGGLSVAGGLLDVPPLFGGSALLQRWLEPVTQAADRLRPALELPRATEWALLLGAVAAAAAGMFGALRLLKPAQLTPARLAPAERGLARGLWEKWDVDELDDLLFVRPVVWISREGLWQKIDVGVVDGTGGNVTGRGWRAPGWRG